MSEPARIVASGEEAPPTSTPAEPRVRMAPSARKDLLRAAAREVFAEKGYAESGLAEIAERAGVNKRLLYYYFPDGRPELFTAVLAETTEALRTVVRAAVTAPANTARRVDRLVKALVAFFEEQPDAFNLLFRDPFGVRDEHILHGAAVVQDELARELSVLFAPSGVPTETLLAIAWGTVAYVITVIEMEVSGTIDHEATLDACMTCILGVMSQIGLRA